MLKRRLILMSAKAEKSDFVDFELPSGLLWAKGNIVKDETSGVYSIGAENDYGTYVSWANTEGHNYGEGYNFTSENYNASSGYSLRENIPITDSSFDIACSKFGYPCHIPSIEDWQELSENTDKEWVNNYNGTGVKGLKFMKKTDHSVFIFLPASGQCSSTSRNYRNSYAYYWSNTYISIYHAKYFCSSNSSPYYTSTSRYYGYPIRPVTLSSSLLSIHLQDFSGNSVTNATINITDSYAQQTVVSNSSGNIVINVIKGTVNISSNYYIIDTKSVIVNDDTNVTIIAEPLFIDFDLPSLKLWANGNIVKDSNGDYSIGFDTDYGALFSWGNIDGHIYTDGYNFTPENYNNTPGKSVTSDIPPTDAEHDAAFANLGSPWHLMSHDDFTELRKYVDQEWVTNYKGTGKNGVLFMKKDNHDLCIFMPAGYKNLNGFHTDEMYIQTSKYDYGQIVYRSNMVPGSTSVKAYGLQIRPVMDYPIKSIFNYSSSTEKTFPAGIYKLECWGAQGGNYNTTWYTGGKGGYSTGILTLESETTLYINVGGRGSDYGSNHSIAAGGSNGGGDGFRVNAYLGCGGGGASDIRIGSNSLYARVIVAGGGGGAGGSSQLYYAGGYGGGESGGDGAGYNKAKPGEGASQTAAGDSYAGTSKNNTTYGTLSSFGTGAGAISGSGYNYACSGGGGGWYGGGYGRHAGAGGGSGYVYTSATKSNYPSGCLLNDSHLLKHAAIYAGDQYSSFISPTGTYITGKEGSGYIRITQYDKI